MLRGFFSRVVSFVRDIFRPERAAPPERPPEPPEPPGKPAPEEGQDAGTWREQGVRFVEPGHAWKDERGDPKPLIEYRKSFMTKEEAIDNLSSIARSKHVLVLVVYDDHVEVWLDYVEGRVS
jgi:hypothetical protein